MWKEPVCKNMLKNRKEQNSQYCTSLHQHKEFNDKQSIVHKSLKKDKNNELHIYLVVLCSNKYIGTSKIDEKTGKLVQPDHGHTREGLAFLIVIMDSIIMTIFLLSIFTVDYIIKLDILRHKQGLLETKQFAVQISKLPKTNDKFGVDQLKAELWNHVIQRIKVYDKEQLPTD